MGKGPWPVCRGDRGIPGAARPGGAAIPEVFLPL